MRIGFLFKILLGAVLFLTIGSVVAMAAVDSEARGIVWQNLLGGSNSEDGFSVQQTTDGGYILLGSSSSSASGNVESTNHGDSDFWVVKLDDTGTLQWQTLLGGRDSDIGRSVQQTADGGYILLGSSSSSASGDVTGTNHGMYSYDIWVVKLDSTGEVRWNTLLGGSEDENGHSVQQTADGGYVVLGESRSSVSGNVTGTNHGSYDFWVVKLDGAGMLQWQNLFGGSDNDFGYSVQQTADGGFILLGDSSSSASGNVTGTNHGGDDFWVVKLDDAGTLQWQTLLGGGNTEVGNSVEQTADGGYILLGWSESSMSGDVTNTNHGMFDFWVVKLDDAGTLQWQQLLGGDSTDRGYSLQQTADGGYVLLGESYSSTSGDVIGTSHGGDDFWVVKLDGAGTLQWQQLLGGNDYDIGRSVQQTTDGGYVLLGDSWSSASGILAGTNHGPWDMWVIRLDADAPNVSLVPGGAGMPGDMAADGRYNDVNGNGRLDFADVVLYFNQMSWIAANEPLSAFDFNGNGRIDFADVVWLFTHL